MENEHTDNLLGTAPVPKLMLKFALPSIIAMLVGALYNIVDQLFIGHAVGTLGNAATNIAFPLTTSCISLALLFGIGGASCFNLALGAGDKKHAPYYAGNSYAMLAICGISLSVITLIFLTPLLKLFGSPADVTPYAKEYVRITALGFPFLVFSVGGGHLVRADGSPKITMISNIAGAIINTILDAVFVLGFGLGMAGAALATIIGQIASTIIVVIYMIRYRRTPIKAEHFRLRYRYVAKTASIGMASFINQIAMMIVQIVLNNYLRYYGGMSEFGESIPIACAGISMKTFQVVFSVVIGLGQGTQPIESFNYGAKKYGRVREAYRLAVIMGMAVSVISFILFQAMPRQIISMFGTGSEEYFRFGIKFFRIFLFFTWLNFLQPITSTFFTSIGKPKKGVFLSLTRQILFFLPILIILPMFFGIMGILYTGPIADAFSAVIAITMAAYEFRVMKKEEKIHLIPNPH